jgi:4a-hydroxytetrahydrobiopterin dehydratase
VPRLLTDEEIGERLIRLDEWKREQRFITKTFEFENFKRAMKFVNKVAEIAERQNHHPDIHVAYDRVTLSIQTHSEGGLTNRDFNLAKKIDRETKLEPLKIRRPL